MDENNRTTRVTRLTVQFPPAVVKKLTDHQKSYGIKTAANVALNFIEVASKLHERNPELYFQLLRTS